jgi:hypothetical protein
MSFQEAIARFLVATHDSKAANAVVDLLQTSQTYAMDNRNRAVEALAKDVEARIGFTANLMFRSHGAIHDALQELMDAYVDDVDARTDAKSHA